MAWLNTAPEAKANSKDQPLIRRKQFQIDGIEPELPPCDAQYLVRYLFAIGPSEVISFQEINAWQQASFVTLSGWEAQTIHDLSIEYLNQQQASKERGCPPPYAPEVVAQQNRDAVAGQLKMFAQVYKLSEKK